MNHEYYRSWFNQYPPLPDDRVVYGPHPNHCNWHKRQWDASQMLPDQNAQHRPYPRWTNANLIGDLGDWGRWREARMLLRANQRATKQGNPEPYPGITSMVVHGAKETAREAIESSGHADLNGAVVMGTIFGGGAGLYAASMGEPLDIVAALVPSAIFATGLLAQMGAGIERDVKEYVMQRDT